MVWGEGEGGGGGGGGDSGELYQRKRSMGGSMLSFLPGRPFLMAAPWKNLNRTLES